jgi:ABC-type oligopeptide transport system ATPase subunit
VPLLDVRGLVKDYPRRHRLLASPTVLRAVDEVSFGIDEGETFGLVGESGSGKTTTGRCILRLIEPTAGTVIFRGEDVLSFPPSRMRAARRDMQMIFQDPSSSLNPRMRVGTSVEEPLVVQGAGTKAERRARVEELFTLVGLEPADLRRYPHEFSGGQRQRIGIARALALHPSLVIADEPVSSLDVSIQAQVINLLMDLQERLRLTYLLIAHADRGDVPRADCRDGADARGLRGPASSLHARHDRGGARGRPRLSARPRGTGPQRVRPAGPVARGRQRSPREGVTARARAPATGAPAMGSGRES